MRWTKGWLYAALLLFLSGCGRTSLDIVLVTQQVEINQPITSCDLIATIDGVELDDFDWVNNQIYLSANKKLSCEAIDVSRLGKTIARYRSGQDVYDIEVVVVDTTPPEISVKEEIVVEVNNEYFDLTALIVTTDNSHEAILPSVDGRVNLEVPGRYELTVMASDASANTTTVKVAVEVVEKEKEIVTIIETVPGSQGDTSNSGGSPANGGQSNGDNSSSSGGGSTSKPKPASKQFLFADGYDMNTAFEACKSYRSAQLVGYSGSGSCEPLKNDAGIYTGYEARFK